MKKLLLMFVMTLVGLVAFAQDPIVSITTVVANQKSGVSSYTASWILGAPESSETWTVENFNNNNSNESWNCMRCGKKSNTSVATITTDFAISASVNKVVVNMIPFIKTIDKDKLTALKLEISSTNDFTAPETTIAAENYMTATQKTEEDVTFTIPEPAANKYYRLVFECASTAANNGFVQVNSISYYGDADPAAGPAAPVVKMAANNMVEISAADGAQIYYTTNGDDPTTESTLYTGAFSISSETVVKAIAVVDGKSSSVATFNAYINTLSSLEELIDLGDFTHTLTVQAPMTIVYHNGRYMYVSQDNSFLLLYGVSSDDTYANGAQLDAVTGSYTLYKDVIPEMTNVTLGNVTEGGTPVDPTAITIAEVNSYGTALMNYFVKLEGVAIDLTNTKLTQDGNELVYYNQFGLTLPEATDGKTYNVEGFMSYHNGNIQINIINVTEVEIPAGEYETYPADNVINRTDTRYTSNIVLTSDGKEQTISDLQSASEKHIYRDATAQIAELAPGATVNVTANYVGSWMHGYLWIDYNKDYQFSYELNSSDLPTASSELVGFSNYNSNPDGGGTWHNSNGTTLSNGGSGTPNAGFSFVVPEDLPAGEYRARYIVDYNILDPTPQPTRSDNTLEKNGGMVADFTIRVTAPTKYTVTIASAEHGTIKVLNGENEITSGSQVNAGTVITIAGDAERGYMLGTATVNGTPIEGFTYEVNEDVEIGGTFVDKVASYTAPAGHVETNGTNTYVETINTTGAAKDMAAAFTEQPTDDNIYALIEDKAEVVPGESFTLNLIAKSLGEYSTSTVRQDIRYTCAYIWADWYGLSEWEKVEFHGTVPPSHNIGGNYDVLNIAQALTMPADVPVGTESRIRVIYSSAWSVPGTNSSDQNQGMEAADPNSQYINGGVAYDIVVNAVAPAPKLYAVTVADTENGTIKLMNGETEVASGTEVEEGTTLTIVATPAENYSLEAITLNDAALAAGEDDSYSFTVSEACTVAATFAINKYAVTITEPENGTLVVMNGEEAVTSGSELAHGTELSIVATPADGYELGAITVNGNAIEGTALTLTEAATIAATFNEAKAPAYEYTAPDGSGYDANYLTAITSTGAQENISYTASSNPGLYNVLSDAIAAVPGSEFSIEFVANSLGEGSYTTVREDLRFDAAYIFADWYGNGEFTLIQKVGNTAPTHNVYGNYDEVMDITQAFTMPEDVTAGTAARIRIIYQNAWKGCGSDDKTATPDPNAANLEKGIAYDIVVNAVAPTFTVTIADTEATVEANVSDLTAVAEGTEVTFTVTAPEGKQIASVTYNDEIVPANADGTYTVTVNANGTFAVTLEDIPQPGKALLVPSANGRNIYTSRIDDAVLGSHTNGSCDANDLRSHNFTYSAWINIKNTTSGPIMGNIQSQFIDATGAFVVSLKDGKLNLSGRGNTSDSGYANEQPSATETTDPGTANDEWVFVSVVADREAKTVTLYKNCKAISHYDVTNKIGLLPDKSSFFIGGNGTSVEFTEVQLWNKALTPDELMDSYNLKFTETPENLAAYYKPAELVEGSTTDLRNLGTVGTDVPGQLLMGTSSYDSSQWTYVYNGTPQDIELIDEDRVLGTAAITLVQPTTEGNSFKVTDAKGKEIAAEVTLFEKLNVVPALAEGVEVLGVIVEADGVKTTYTLDQFPIRATGDMTISLRLNDLFKVIATAENGTVTISVNDGEATAVAAEGTEVANGSKVVLTFTGNEGAVFKSLTVNGEDAQLTDGTYTIDAIDADYTLAAIYDLFTYKLTIINPSDDPTPENNVYGEFVDNQMNRLEYEDADGLDVTPGATVYLLISFAENHGVADSYYEFTKLTDNGVEVPRTNLFPGGENCYIYPMSNIQADHTFVIDQQLYDGIIGVGVDAEGMISFAGYTIRVAADNAQIDIFDLNGRTLRSVAANEITVSDLVKGVYFAKATVNGKAYTFKFIKL
mgnify:FL=1